MRYLAHACLEESGDMREQSVEEHCRTCAAYAAQVALPGLEKITYLAALLHDMGKYTPAFCTYLLRAARGEPVRRGSVNHTFAGVRFVWERWHEKAQSSYYSLTAEIVAFAIGSHHGQFDIIAPEGTDGFRHRLIAEGVDYATARDQFLTCCAGLEELDTLFEAAVTEVTEALKRSPAFAQTREEQLFGFSLLSRLVLSAVIEGDRRDTAEFAAGISVASSEPEPWGDYLAAVEARIRALPTTPQINHARRRISDCCRESAGRGAGIYRLTVPTGGGKTLTALRYALAAAAQNRKKRIFFVIPLLSVLDQNAAVIRDYLADACPILEHHSNLVQEEVERGEHLMENWQAPVVITTLVQFLNTLFAGQSSCIRRMAALSESVIVLDEVQSVPRHMLTIFNLALNFLAGFCEATVVLCSATQPCLESASHPLRYADHPELVPYDATIWDMFCRTDIVDYRRSKGYTMEELADFAVSCAQTHGSLLLINNTKTQARELFWNIRERWGGKLYHLSTAMCMEHRLAILQKILAALAAHEQIICVSTQLVEAGVDFSFGCVIRVLAGMENVVQSAGRCNRNGEFGRRRPVYIVNICGENLNRLKDILHAQQAAESLLLQFRQTQQRFEGGLTGEKAIQTYYHTLYGEMKQGEQDYPLSEYGTTLFDLLSGNDVFRRRILREARPAYFLGQAFRTAGEAFHVFEDNTRDVLVPYGDGKELILALGSQWGTWDMAKRREMLRRAGRFSVSLYEYEWKRLCESGGVYDLCDGLVMVLQPAFYTDDTGFSWQGEGMELLEA